MTLRTRGDPAPLAPLRRRSKLLLEYKYIVRGADGGIHAWKPGANYALDVPIQTSGVKVNVKDTWDHSLRTVEIQGGVREINPNDETAAVESAVSRLSRGGGSPPWLDTEAF